jgi:hypothetical protein
MATNDRGEIMRKCGTVFTKGECDGHYGGKFDDCIAEALDSAGPDCADEDTGSCDFEGFLMLFLFEETQGIDVDQNGERLAMVPPGNYILYTASGGGVQLWKYETPGEAADEMQRWSDRYALWDKGCEQVGHEECAQHDICVLGGTPSY